MDQATTTTTTNNKKKRQSRSWDEPVHPMTEQSTDWEYLLKRRYARYMNALSDADTIDFVSGSLKLNEVAKVLKGADLPYHDVCITPHNNQIRLSLVSKDHPSVVASRKIIEQFNEPYMKGKRFDSVSLEDHLAGCFYKIGEEEKNTNLPKNYRKYILKGQLLMSEVNTYIQRMARGTLSFAPSISHELHVVIAPGNKLSLIIQT